MPVKEHLKQLIELQKIDSQIYQLRFVEKEEIPRRMKRCDEELAALKKGFAEKEGKLKTFQLEKKNKELDLLTKEGNVKKFQLQLNQVKTNKEYAALEKEIEGLKADNSLLEEEIIRLLDELDSITELLGRDKEELDEESRKIQREKEDATRELEQVKQKLSELEDSRKAVVQEVDPLILPRYERVLKLRGGTAVVPIRNDSCQGCFMNLPPQVINLVCEANEWVVCEQCARILYVENEAN